MEIKYSEKAVKQLKEIEQDRDDYFDAVEVKKTNKKWISHSEVKKELGIQ